MTHPVRVGIGGWTFEPWRGTFYPEKWPQKRELEYASRKLTAIEINGTFYRTQNEATFAKWREETPEGFVFCLKGHRYTTSRKTAGEMKESVAWFLNSGVAALGDRLGVINWQFAPNRKFDAEFVGAFLSALPAEWSGRRLRHVLEVRHASFDAPAFLDMLDAADAEASVVFADDDDWPAIRHPGARFVYARLMRTREGEAEGYPPAELDAWAREAKAWAQQGETFVFFISGAKASDPAAAMGLQRRLGVEPAGGV